MVGMTLAAALSGAGLIVVLVDSERAAVRAAATSDGRSSAIAHGSQQALAGSVPAFRPFATLSADDASHCEADVRRDLVSR